ncbi:MAG: single-stranded-DNA-specific exonuclease RecJ [Clostridiales bacterium]|nr:single-stranded-DNA-specific exonuclease RecJ [Clostridiales bacterium]
MLQFIKRGPKDAQPIGDLPLWLSALLRGRGVDTPEKAERFLYPSLAQLHDPFLMQGMDRAVLLIREAVEEDKRIIIYGDYDVDGVCATSILLETLHDMGAKADFRIPSRHGEGYGLNCDAVREMAATHQLLITVDCGITNCEEVKLAKLLGMTVIVTDHHQLADQLPPADAVLNPLLGAYPFRRLCGAGVALKLTQALLGMDAVLRRIDLAALATVADIVPLIDENRVIVREGLLRMADSQRPGLRALMQLSDVHPPVNAGHVGFRLAPRLNAGGRLEDASQGVLLLTAPDSATADPLALHLENANQQRQAIETDITQQAMAMIVNAVDFRDDRVIILMGEGWNHGVIGLAAGRICEKYHFPTIVLTRNEEGVAVGSCRSIPGVNIHAMLTTCKDLFMRFGGHEQAAGLTMRAELLPELRRRLNLAINESCDLRCYIPAREYDLTLRLREVDLDMIDRLDLLQPTGYGNPNPVFLARDAHLQQALRVGKNRNHLKLLLLDGQTLRDGIAFGKGEAADEGFERVDVLFTPARNEFRGRVTPQLMVEALTPAEGAIPLPEENTLFWGLLQEIMTLAENIHQIPAKVESINGAAVRKLMQTGRGVLLIGHEREAGVLLLSEMPCDVVIGTVKDERGFNTLLMNPDLARLTDVWTDILWVDGALLPGEAAAVAEKCPRARLHAMKENPALTALLTQLAMDDETLRTLYRRVRLGGTLAASQLSADTGLSLPQVLTGLMAFQQVRLVEASLEPYAVRLLPPQRCRMDDSPLVRYLRGSRSEL